MKHLLLSFFFVALLSCNSAANTTENCLPKKQEKSLIALGQLWGFLKYHHPAVSEGKLDWDAELIKIIPSVMNAQNEEEWKVILDNWVDSLGSPAKPCVCGLTFFPITLQDEKRESLYKISTLHTARRNRGFLRFGRSRDVRRRTSSVFGGKSDRAGRICIGEFIAEWVL